MWWLVAALVAAEPAEVSNFLDFDYVHHGEDWQGGECSSRDRQSPIDFSDMQWNDIAAKRNTFYYDYMPVTQFNYQNNGHGIAADVGGEGIGGVVFGLELPTSTQFYNLQSINFHVQSEHTFQGKRFPLEIHLVHKMAGGAALLVIAIPVEEGPGTTLNAFADAPTAYNRGLRYNATDVNAFLGTTGLNATGGTYFSYSGSLTVPPCIESVNWLVRRETITAPAEILKSLSDGVLSGTSGFGNFRMALPLGDREVTVMNAVQGNPPTPVKVSKFDVDESETFEGQTAQVGAYHAAKEANEAVRFLDAKLVRASRAHLAITGELPPAEAPPAPVAAEAAKAADSTVRTIAEEIGRHVGGNIRGAMM